jgi:DnaJ-class molecular chaperone
VTRKNFAEICPKCNGKGYITEETELSSGLCPMVADLDCDECCGLGVIEEEIEKSKFKKDSTRY